MRLDGWEDTDQTSSLSSDTQAWEELRAMIRMLAGVTTGTTEEGT